MVPRLSILTYQFKAATTLTLNGHDIETQVASWLSANGFTTLDFQIVTPSATEVLVAIYGYTVQITMKIRSSIDYGDESDIQSIFDHAVYQVTGNLPSASDIISVDDPGSDVKQTAPDTGGGGGGGGTKSSFWDSVVNFLEGAGVGTILGIGLVVVAIILIVGWAESRKLI